jgi:CysZ protein
MKLQELLAGLKCHRRAHRLVIDHKLWRLIIIPGFLSLFYLPLVIWVTFYGLKPLTRYLHENWVPEFLQSAFTLLLLGILVWALGIYVGYLLFRNVIMILCSPLLGYLSETTEKVEGGIEPPKFTWKGVGPEILRAIGLSLLSLLVSAGAFFICLIIGIIPVLGAVVAFVLMTLIQAYLAGVGFADPALERRRFTISATLKFARRHRPRLMGVGLGFVILMAVPVVGWFLAPSYGIIAGTLAALDLLNEENPGQKPPKIPEA